jgi:transcription elongation factor GreB
MSKAFTRESDDSPDLPLVLPRPTLPPGIRNYMTKDGAEQLRKEAARLSEERSNRDLNVQVALTRLNLRLRQIEDILLSAVVVETPPAEQNTVRFGAYVTTLDSRGEETVYRIVGIHEVDLDRDWISWQSPLARALLNKQVGDSAIFLTPAGQQTLKIVKISY